MAYLKIENMRKRFGHNQVLKGIGFELEKGEVLAIIGASGSGKTTLLRCINYLEQPDTGKIVLGGETLLDIAQATLDRKTLLSDLKHQLKAKNVSARKNKSKRLSAQEIKAALAEYDAQLRVESIPYRYEKRRVNDIKTLRAEKKTELKKQNADARAAGKKTLSAQEIETELRRCEAEWRAAGIPEVIAKKAAKKRTENEIRRNRLHFGMVFQSFNLFPHYNVLTNVTLAADLLAAQGKKDERFSTAKNANRDKAVALLGRVGLSDKLTAYPCELSGGQQQRVAIARALALEPEILCFDEPTSALDPELTGEVLKVIRGLKSGDTTMIIVTHEMAFARDVADKVIFMADGVIEECGTPEEVFGNPRSEKTRAFLRRASENREG